MNFAQKLKQPESRKLEFKREFPTKSDILKTIVAFANGAGGELIIGVSDHKREIIGVKDPLLLEEKISNMVFDGIQPFVSPFISVMNVAGKPVLIVKVLPGVDRPYYKKSEGVKRGVYVRVGSTNRRGSPEIIDEVRRQGRGITFETEIDISKGANHFDDSSLSRFFASIGQSGYTKETLTKWRFLQKNNGDYFPTIAGLVLFGKQDLIDYDFANVRLTRYQGTTLSNISETKEYGVPIIEKVESICRDIAGFLRKESYLKGAQRLERTIIPTFAIREVVVNAIVHRDYSMIGSSVKISVFDDRLEVVSPGILFGHIDISDIGTGLSECRNRSVVRVFRKLNLMEELGTGIARIYELYREEGLKKPLFLEQGQYFKAVLPQHFALENNQDKIYELMRTSGGTSASEMAERLNLHHNTVLKNLKQLIKIGKVEKIGTGKKIRYLII